MTKCAKCPSPTINGRLLCDDCMAASKAAIAERAKRYSSKGKSCSDHYEPTPEEIAAGIAAIKARWSDAEYYHRAGCQVPTADIREIDTPCRGLDGRIIRRGFSTGN